MYCSELQLDAVCCSVLCAERGRVHRGRVCICRFLHLSVVMSECKVI